MKSRLSIHYALQYFFLAISLMSFMRIEIACNFVIILAQLISRYLSSLSAARFLSFYFINMHLLCAHFREILTSARLALKQHVERCVVFVVLMLMAVLLHLVSIQFFHDMMTVIV